MKILALLRLIPALSLEPTLSIIAITEVNPKTPIPHKPKRLSYDGSQNNAKLAWKGSHLPSMTAYFSSST
jgi:hypothetical protein